MALDLIQSFARRARNYMGLGLVGQAGAGHLYYKPMAAEPSAADAEGRTYWDAAANGLKQNDGVQFRALSDRHLVTTRVTATDVDRNVFVADRAYKLVAARYVNTTAGTDAGAVTLDVKKCDGTEAPSAGLTMLGGTINLKTAANTVITPTLTATAADLALAAGERIAMVKSGTMTAVEGVLDLVLEQV